MPLDVTHYDAKSSAAGQRRGFANFAV